MKQSIHSDGVRVQCRPSHMQWRRTMLGSAAGALLATGPAVQAQVAPTPFVPCPPNAFLFQGNPDVSAIGIELITGEAEVLAPDFHGNNINGIGYNTLDNFIYGWDNDNPAQLVRVGSNWVVEQVGTPAGTGRSVIGDVDENGHFWTIVGGEWYQIDLADAGTPGWAPINSGPFTGDSIASFEHGADWAYIDGTDALYRVMRNPNTTPESSVLIRFDRDGSGTLTNLGNLGQLGDNGFGAVYSDAAGFLYASDNVTGQIFRINVTATPPTAELFSPGPDSGSNDGARCFAAPILIDFSDAPDSYGTTLATDGARHGLVDFDEATNTAPLMLGTQVGADDDGQPSDGADADAFDDGVTAPIRYRIGQQTTIRVIVTNNTDEVATLAAWMDVGGTGTFADDAAIVEAIPANSGTQQYELTFPPVTFDDGSDTYARFRLFPGAVAAPSPIGAAGAGEVEDYLVTQWRAPVGVPLDTPWMLALLVALLGFAGSRIARRRYS